jgi:hypothetical protein
LIQGGYAIMNKENKNNGISIALDQKFYVSLQEIPKK